MVATFRTPGEEEILEDWAGKFSPEVEEMGLNEETEEKEKDDKEMEEEGNLLTVYSTVWSLPSGSRTW